MSTVILPNADNTRDGGGVIHSALTDVQRVVVSAETIEGALLGPTACDSRECRLAELGVWLADGDRLVQDLIELDAVRYSTDVLSLCLIPRESE